MRKLLIVIISFIILFSTKASVQAKNLLESLPNNKFGIHVTNEKDFRDAANLVNSSGGDWGYVTFVITESERNFDRWQKAFDEARRLHLIPIVRIATAGDGDGWIIPKKEEITNWIAFLNSLNWVVKNRYVVIGNEPNHANEWGGEIDPVSYAEYLNNFAIRLHEASADFFILPAGLDASAKNTANTMDEAIYLKRMLMSIPDLFNNLDGWVSHSYPNPDFAGKATDTGRGSIHTFEWELSYLQSLGVQKDLPVFITETGWSNDKVPVAEISSMYNYAFKNVWNDKRVVAVTPFILNYPDQPFSMFSWKKSDGSFNSYYDAYKNISKIKGEPLQIKSGQIIAAIAQPIIPKGSNFWGAILAKNTGQSIWSSANIKAFSDNNDIRFISTLLFDIEPSHTRLIIYKASTGDNEGILIKSIYLSDSDSNRITNSFPVEGVIVKANKVQIGSIFDKIGSRLRSVVP